MTAIAKDAWNESKITATVPKLKTVVDCPRCSTQSVILAGVVTCPICGPVHLVNTQRPASERFPQGKPSPRTAPSEAKPITLESAGNVAAVTRDVEPIPATVINPAPKGAQVQPKKRG